MAGFAMVRCCMTEGVVHLAVSDIVARVETGKLGPRSRQGDGIPAGPSTSNPFIAA